MDEDEKLILSLLSACYVKYSTLPGLSQDALEIFAGGIHTCQVELLARAHMREHPEIFAQDHTLAAQRGENRPDGIAAVVAGGEIDKGPEIGSQRLPGPLS